MDKEQTAETHAANEDGPITHAPELRPSLHDVHARNVGRRIFFPSKKIETTAERLARRAAMEVKIAEYHQRGPESWRRMLESFEEDDEHERRESYEILMKALKENLL